MNHRSVLATPTRILLTTLAAIGLLGVAMAACVPQPPRPRSPEQPLPLKPSAKPKPAATPEAATAGKSLDQATDLFNRGENDLACEQVNQAIQLQSRTPDALSAERRSQLDQYRQACQAE
ncbi:MAG: hypothetical protein RLZZ631_406 [Cyanobacteriota bacterium]